MVSGLSMVSAIHQDLQPLWPSDQFPITSPFTVNHPNQLSPSLILSDQFSIDGTGGKVCDRINQAQINDDRKGVNAGLIHISFTANQSVNFWILNSPQYSGWSKASTCSIRLGASSILTLASRSDYSNSSVLIPKTDDYYFIFDNPNLAGVSVSLVVDYPPSIKTASTIMKLVLTKQFILNGVKGTPFGCFTQNYNTPLDVGRLSVSYSSTGPVDFWILNPTQYKRLNDVMDVSCRNGQTAQSIFSQFYSNAYDGSVQFNSTDTYYFVFSNSNQNPAFITLSVGVTNPAMTTTTSAGILQSLPFGSGQLQQILGAAATGGSIILGWLFKTRKRRFLSSYLTKIDSTYNQYATNRAECKKALETMKTEILQMLKTGKIDEAHFTILQDKITQYLTELR